MSDSSLNPFASPGKPLTEGATESAAREPVELRSVSFSGKLSDEETQLLLDRKTLKPTDFAFLFSIAAIIASIIAVAFLLRIRFDILIFGAYHLALFLVVILWAITRIRYQPYWLAENAEGVINKNGIVIRYEGSEIHLLTSEQKIHFSSHGMRIDIGQQSMLRHFLISRHWFQPREFEIAKACVKHAIEPKSETAELNPLIANRSASALPFYSCSRKTRFLNHSKLLFGSLFTVLIAIFFITFGICLKVFARPGIMGTIDAIAGVVFSIIGAGFLISFFVARAKIYHDQNRHVSPDPATQDQIGWIDSGGFVSQVKNGVVKSRWDEHIHHTSFVDSLGLFCPLADPWYIYLHPAQFESRTDWQRAKSIMKHNTNSSTEVARKNSKLLKLLPFNRAG